MVSTASSTVAPTVKMVFLVTNHQASVPLVVNLVSLEEDVKVVNVCLFFTVSRFFLSLCCIYNLTFYIGIHYPMRFANKRLRYMQCIQTLMIKTGPQWLNQMFEFQPFNPLGSIWNMSVNSCLSELIYFQCVNSGSMVPTAHHSVVETVPMAKLVTACQEIAQTDVSHSLLAINVLLVNIFFCLLQFYHFFPTVQLIGPLWSSYLICRYSFQIPQWVLKLVKFIVKLFWKVTTNFIVHYWTSPDTWQMNWQMGSWVPEGDMYLINWH